MPTSAGLDLGAPALHLSFLPVTYQVLHLAPATPLPAALMELLTSPARPMTFLSLTRTPEETSLIVPSSLLPSFEPLQSTPEYQREGPWVVLKVRGPMELHMTGVMSALCAPLKEAGVAIFASSTWDTDYVLIHEEDQLKAEGGLKAAGWVFV